MTNSQSQEPSFFGYTVTSTAPLNVEEETNLQETWNIKCLKDGNTEVPNIQDIAKKLYNKGKESELIIGVHGYAQGTEDPFWHKGIFQHFSKNPSLLENDKNYVFLGYHWPSEKPPLCNNFVSMSGTILGALLGSIFFVLSWWILVFLKQKYQLEFDHEYYIKYSVMALIYIVVSLILLSQRHHYNRPLIEKCIDYVLYVFSCSLLLVFSVIVSSSVALSYPSYDPQIITSLFLVVTTSFILLFVQLLVYSKGLNLLAPTLPTSMCIVISLEFILLHYQPLTSSLATWIRNLLKIGFGDDLTGFKNLLHWIEILLKGVGTLLNEVGSLLNWIGILLFGIITALILLRFVGYFRDSYRANHFGVPDLVELIRQLDRAIFLEKHISKLTIVKEDGQRKLLKYANKNLLEEEKMIVELFEEMSLSPDKWDTVDKIDLWKKEGKGFSHRKKVEKNIELFLQNEQDNRVKLSFIGHSMGCFVITNTIRILSDVFDSNSLYENPGSDIGKYFNLERLILVAPDIPVETIITGRANFLRASLRRVKEAYIFSNEGDIVLRILSATANYFSFPTNVRIRGSRLGILTVKDDDGMIDKSKNKREPSAYGIVNYVDNNVKPPSDHLEIRDSGNKPLKLSKQCDNSENYKQDQIADLFTYFDCTDYQECINDDEISTVNKQASKNRNNGEKYPVVSQALKKPKLGIWEYFMLTLISLLPVDKIPFLKCRKIDVHSDYFKGNFTKKAIYEIAFLGLKGFLTELANDSDKKDDKKYLLEPFGEMCQTKQIRVVISPKHFKLLNSGTPNNTSGTSAPDISQSQS